MSRAPATAMQCRVFLVRHGTPVNDQAGFSLRAFELDMRGQKDEPLSDVGRTQASCTGRYLAERGVELVVSSGLQRARQTAEILVDCCAATAPPVWRELDEVIPGAVGAPAKVAEDFDGARPAASRRPAYLTVRYRLLSSLYLLLWALGLTRGGDSKSKLKARFAEVRQQLQGLSGQGVAVVGHGYWFLLFLSFVLEWRRWAWWRALFLVTRGGFWLSNCSVTELRFCPEQGWNLVSFAQLPPSAHSSTSGR